MEGAVAVALITSVGALLGQLINVIANSKNNKDLKKSNIIKDTEETKKMLTDFIETYKIEHQKTLDKIDKNRRNELRSILADSLSRQIKMLQSKKKLTKEEIENVENNFEEYTSLGGNHYIKDLHEIWQELFKKGGLK